MAFLALALSALLSAANPAPSVVSMACSFASDDAGGATWISVRPERAPAARPGLFKVSLWIEGQQMAGNVVPLVRTEARDVVVRGVTADRTTWLIAVRDNGSAYLRAKGPAEDAAVIARTGTCSHYRAAFEVWLAS